ncbi:MAG: hydantoinase/oxoprolinase family protein [Chloroflexota bacterium]
MTDSPNKPTIALGIDTGGTYTDAVLVNHDTGEVLATAKSLTTRHDLAIGITNSMNSVFAEAAETISAQDIEMVALSTTLATNAIVEGQGSPVALFLVGYDPKIIEQYGFEKELVTKDVVYLRGGHNGLGKEQDVLDEAGVREAVLARKDEVEAFAVSSFFSVRNPAHELRVKEIVRELTETPDGRAIPVTCGHELTSNLNAVRRATTVALNARLIPLLQELIVTVQTTMSKLGINAPLMVVKGDGSLVRAEWAEKRPIETILSGPAASVIGAAHLSDKKDVWMVDVGGTTTDIAALTEGRPRLNPDGATVAEWQTMIEAIDVYTVGLGGDSHVQVSETHLVTKDWLELGPRRVIPLYLLEKQAPDVIEILREQLGSAQQSRFVGQFIVPQQQRGYTLHPRDQMFLDQLGDAPQSALHLIETLRRPSVTVMRQIDRLRSQRLVMQAGFTPTDALHVLGRFPEKSEAAQLGAELLSKRAGLTPEAFCETVVTAMSEGVATELLNKVLSDEARLPNWSKEPTAKALLKRALNPSLPSSLVCQIQLKEPIVAIGAPVEAYLPQSAEYLNTELIIPEASSVANAVGAVVGSVVQQVRVTIQPVPGKTVFRVYLPEEQPDFVTVEACVNYAQDIIPNYLEQLAYDAGADHVDIKLEREDQIIPVTDVDELHIQTTLTYTAMGRPRKIQD